MTKLQRLMEFEGYEDQIEFLEDCASDSVVPGICTVRGCEGTADVEPDCDDGYCELCGNNKIKSALVLAGVI